MRFKVSKEARDDIREIGRYTQRKWGKDQRRNYLNDLDKKFGLLAENPLLGRRCDSIREGDISGLNMSATLFFTGRKKTLSLFPVSYTKASM